MRILLHASHLLHWRSLLPVAIELSHRGHEIVVQTTRPDWLGMPTWQMHWRPTKVTGINKTSLAWLAEKIGYAAEWKACETHYYLWEGMAPDVCVTTTKDLKWAREKVEMGYQTFAVGYQHIPFVVQLEVGSCGPIEPLGPFGPGHPFCQLHNINAVLGLGFAHRCGFPHLDKIPVRLEVPRPTILLQHPGGYRGIGGYQWMVDVCRVIVDAGYDAAITPHIFPGWGYDDISLHYAMKAKFPYSTGFWFAPYWRQVASGCALILTTGSSAAYEMWSVGLTNVFILGYVGGTRHEKFGLFKDLRIESPEALRKLLRSLPGSAQATEPLTREVMEAYRSIHTGQGAKTAADVVEGK